MELYLRNYCNLLQELKDFFKIKNKYLYKIVMDSVRYECSLYYYTIYCAWVFCGCLTKSYLKKVNKFT